MKLMIAGEEVTITVKGQHKDRATKEDAQFFLNTLCCYAGEAIHRYEELGLNALLEETRQFRDDIMKALEHQGFYSC